MPNIFPRRALRSDRRIGLDATRDFCHGLLTEIQVLNRTKDLLIDQLAQVDRQEWAALVSAFVRSLGTDETSDRQVSLTLIVDLVSQVSRLPCGRMLPRPSALAKAIESRDYFWSSNTEELFSGLAEELAKWLSRTQPAAQVREVSEFIDAHCSERLTIVGLAKRFGCSPRRLSHAFKKDSGFTVHGYIVRQRILRALQLIKYGEKVEVAMLEVGYHNKTHFNRAFRQLTGKHPGQLSSRRAASRR